MLELRTIIGAAIIVLLAAVSAGCGGTEVAQGSSPAPLVQATAQALTTDERSLTATTEERSSSEAPVTANDDGIPPTSYSFPTMDSNGMPYSQEILDAMQGDSTGYAESRDTSTVPATATMATEPWYPLGHSSELAAPIGTRVSMNSENIDPAKNATGYAIVHQIKNWDVPGERPGVAIEVEYDIDDQRIYSGANFLARHLKVAPQGSLTASTTEST